MPIVSGNVSLYNESKATGGGSAILPTPAIGAVGLLDDWEKSATIAFKAEAEKILLIGADPKLAPHLGQSLWMQVIHEQRAGRSPIVNLDRERRHGEFVRHLIAEGLATAVHDVSDGGIAVAVAEMALAGNIGARLSMSTFEDYVDAEVVRHDWSLFGENQSRYLVTEPMDRHVVEKLAREHGVGCCFIGWTAGDTLYFGDGELPTDGEIPLADLRAAHEGFFPALMGAMPA